MNFANNVIIRDASGIFRSKREVIDLASEGAMESEVGEEEGEDDVCAQHVWLQTTFLTDESDDEDDEDAAEMGNLFDCSPYLSLNSFLDNDWVGLLVLALFELGRGSCLYQIFSPIPNTPTFEAVVSLFEVEVERRSSWTNFFRSVYQQLQVSGDRRVVTYMTWEYGFTVCPNTSQAMQYTLHYLV